LQKKIENSRLWNIDVFERAVCFIKMNNFVEYAKSLERHSKKLDCCAAVADDLRTIHLCQ